MVFNKPSIIDITSFDATEDQKIYFNVSGGDLYTEIEIYVNEREHSNIVTKWHQEIKENNFILPANSLENNKNYAMSIRIGSNGVWSERSASDYFSCYARPQISINEVSPDGKTVIENRNYVFTGTYVQPTDPIRYFRFVVYNEDNSLFYDSGNIYENVISTKIVDFKNDANYIIELSVLSQSGISNTSGRLAFHVKYDKTNMDSQMSIVCDNTSGDVVVRAILKKQEGSYYGYEESTGFLSPTEEVPIYETHKDNTGKNTKWVVVPKNKAIIFDSKDNFLKGYTLQIWFSRNSVNRFVLGKIYAKETVMTIIVDKDVIELNCNFNGKETVYGLRIAEVQQAELPINETIRIRLKDCGANIEYMKGGSLL